MEISLKSAGGIGDVGAQVFHSVDQSIPNAVDTPLVFNSERYDTHAFHDTVVNNSRLTIPAGQAGEYVLWTSVAMAAFVGGGTLYIAFTKNGVTSLAQSYQVVVAGSGVYDQLTALARLAAGDYVQATLYQNSGLAVNARVLAEYSVEFALQRVG